MKINSKEHWEKFVYGLLYPGFVGSMLYELILAEKNHADIANYTNPTYIIKVVITLFYCIDYLHLYGDMHEVTKDYQRDSVYIWCDILSSIFFFASFVAVKLEHFTLALIFIALIPLFFTAYKLRNKADRKFQFWYLGGSIVFAALLVLCQKQYIHFNHLGNSKYNMLGFTAISMVFYVFYVFFYYDKKSLKEDIKIYGYIQPEDNKKKGIPWKQFLKQLIVELYNK